MMSIKLKTTTNADAKRPNEGVVMHSSDVGFASSTIGIMLGMLKERYTEKEILKFLKRKNIKAILKII